MKKITALFSAAMFFTMMSCSNEPAATNKEVIVIPVEKKVEPKPTSITLDKNGVQVETKKVNVKVKPGN